MANIKGDLNATRNISAGSRVSTGTALVMTDWVTATDYTVNDTLVDGSKVYVCKTDHTSGVSLAADLANWEEAGSSTTAYELTEVAGIVAWDTSISNNAYIDMGTTSLVLFDAPTNVQDGNLYTLRIKCGFNNPTYNFDSAYNSTSLIPELGDEFSMTFLGNSSGELVPTKSDIRIVRNVVGTSFDPNFNDKPHQHIFLSSGGGVFTVDNAYTKYTRSDNFGRPVYLTLETSSTEQVVTFESDYTTSSNTQFGPITVPINSTTTIELLPNEDFSDTRFTCRVFETESSSAGVTLVRGSVDLGGSSLNLSGASLNDFEDVLSITLPNIGVYEITALVYTLSNGGNDRFIRTLLTNASNIQIGQDITLGVNDIASTEDYQVYSAGTAKIFYTTTTVNEVVKLRAAQSSDANVAYINNETTLMYTQLPDTSIVNAGSISATDEASSGYMDIGSMRMQWGITGNSSGSENVVLPVSFLNSTYTITLTPLADTASAINGQVTARGPSNFDIRKVFITDSGGGGSATEAFMWQAIGLKP